MKRLLLCLIGLITIVKVQAQQAPATATLDKVKVDFMLTDGKPEYQAYFNGKAVVKPSAMGFTLNDGTNLNSNFTITGIEKTDHDDTWKPVWGEVGQIRDHYQQLVVHLKQGGSSRLMDIVFRVFADGVGFRYVFPKQPNLKYFIISDEQTEFTMTGDHKAFWIPADYDTNEYEYSHTSLSEVDSHKVSDAATDIAVRVAPDPSGVQTPLMLKTADGLYINIHEAALVDFSSMQLHVDKQTFKLSARLVPDAVGNLAYVHAPFSTPWRTIIVSDKATDILASKLILNLNEPSKLTTTDWIKPTKFVGVWWEMQTGKGTWNYGIPDSTDASGNPVPNGKHSGNTANVKRYIDFAAQNGIGAVLVEGWNIGWEDWFGNWKENVFSFVTPYPDFDVKGIQDYAASKGVKMIMHNETSGSATDYERQMDTAYRFMNKFGYPAVKTGYVGKIIPRGEHHDGQWMANHYIRVAQKAAQYHVMLDAHEPVRPTGLQRTYPNWMASEAGRGNEYNADFSPWGNIPAHETIMPFTRLIGGPMDYTPGIFKMTNYTSSPVHRIHTTLAKQLALYVTMYSPLQMAADMPENYAPKMDAFQFIKDVAVDWDDTKVIEAEPGEYITVARKAKGTDNWFLGAITNENGRTTTIDLSFLDKNKKYTADIYADAPNADWDKNPEAYKITHVTVTSKTKLKLILANGGGAAVAIKAE